VNSQTKRTLVIAAILVIAIASVVGKPWIVHVTGIDRIAAPNAMPLTAAGFTFVAALNFWLRMRMKKQGKPLPGGFVRLQLTCLFLAAAALAAYFIQAAGIGAR